MDGYHASQAANPNTIPVADATGKLAADWLPDMEAVTVGGYAPSVTPGPSRLVTSDAYGKISQDWLPPVEIPKIPTGTIIHVASSVPPSGFLKANGAAVSRSAYAGLFAAIGITFGAGDGSTTFNLPDLRGEFIRGWDDGRGLDTGRAFGSYQGDQLQEHRHWSGVVAYPSTSDNPCYTGEGWTGVERRSSQARAAQMSSSSTRRFGVTSNPIKTGIGVSYDSTYNTQQEAANTSARTGSETRPCNKALLACIKY